MELINRALIWQYIFVYSKVSLWFVRMGFLFPPIILVFFFALIFGKLIVEPLVKFNTYYVYLCDTWPQMQKSMNGWNLAPVNRFLSFMSILIYCSERKLRIQKVNDDLLAVDLFSIKSAFMWEWGLIQYYITICVFYVYRWDTEVIKLY